MSRLQNPLQSMPTYNARHWYWNVRSASSEQVYSSRDQAFVSKAADAGYLAFVAAGGSASTIKDKAELADVLNAQAASDAPWAAKGLT